MQNKDRARQFMPFNSLSGYFEMLEEAERIVVEKRELTEDELAKLNYLFPKIKKGMMIKITYYDKNSYRVKEGMVSKINLDTRSITLVKTEILFEDILDIEL